MKRHNKNARPLLVGDICSFGHVIRVWCNHCGRYHKHGWDSSLPANDVVHRGAHCDMDSPYREHGYFIGVRPDDGSANLAKRLKHLKPGRANDYHGDKIDNEALDKLCEVAKRCLCYVPRAYDSGGPKSELEEAIKRVER